MSKFRVTVVSMATVVGIAFWGMAVYSEDAMAGKVPVDGYGVSLVAAN